VTLRRRPGAPRPPSGFTLLEVMVALAILAMSLLSLSDVVGGALRNHVRAAHLDVATLLARGKLVALQEEFERKGFRDFDQTDEGSFDDQGHPEVRWKVEVKRPDVQLGPDKILALLTGGQGLDLLSKAQAGASPGAAPQPQDPRVAMFAALLQPQLTLIGEELKKSVRELRLTVSWPEGKGEDSFSVVTHLVVLNPTEPGS